MLKSPESSGPATPDLSGVVRHNAPVVLIAVLFVAYGVWQSRILGFSLPTPTDYVLAVRTLLTFCAALILALFGLELVKVRPKSPFAHFKIWAREQRLSDRVWFVAPAFFALIFQSTTFGVLKSAIPLAHPFGLDPLFANIDAQIHGGDPWRLIQPIVGYPIISSALNLTYHLWFALVFFVALFVMGWLERPALRLQYLIAHSLCWILLGAFAATSLSSCGPVFYEHFYGDDRFVPLTTYLTEAGTQFPMPALEVQNALLHWAKTGGQGAGGGISAMPSMHLSIATLFALLGWSVSKRWGIAATVFLGLILIGSVHLGYHYAIDGYVSIVATSGIWWVCGVVARAYLARQARAFAAVPV